MPSSRVKIAVFLLAAILIPGRARAATDLAGLDDLAGVYDRAVYANTPPARQYGSFLYSPVVGVNEIYDDNIYRKPGSKQSDLISVVSPGLNIDSDMDMYTLGLRADGNFGYYRTHSHEDFQDYALSAHGGWSMDYATFLNGYVSEEKAHEDRSSPDDPGADRPVEYHLSTQDLNFTRALGILKLYLDAARNQLTFGDSTKGPIVIDNSFRDRDIYSLTSKLAYEFSPDDSLFTSLKYDTRQYLHTGTLDRDSVGYDLRVGTDFAITGKVKGEAYVGNLHRTYSALPDINAVDYGGSLLWNTTDLTSVTVTVERFINETTFAETTSAVTTSAGVTVQHSLRPNLFLLGSTGIADDDYKADNLVAPRHDRGYSGGIGLKYLLTGDVSASLGYEYTKRQSTLSIAEFEDNAIRLTVAYGF